MKDPQETSRLISVPAIAYPDVTSLARTSGELGHSAVPLERVQHPGGSVQPSQACACKSGGSCGCKSGGCASGKAPPVPAEAISARAWESDGIDLGHAVPLDLTGNCPRDVPNCARVVFDVVRAWADRVWPQLGPDHRLDPRTGEYWQSYLDLTLAERESTCGPRTCGETALCFAPHGYLTLRNDAIRTEFLRVARERCGLSETRALEALAATRETSAIALCAGQVHRYLEVPPPDTIRVDLCRGRIRWHPRDLQPRFPPPPLPGLGDTIVPGMCICENCDRGYISSGCLYDCSGYLRSGRYRCDCLSYCPVSGTSISEISLRAGCDCTYLGPR